MANLIIKRAIKKYNPKRKVLSAKKKETQVIGDVFGEGSDGSEKVRGSERRESKGEAHQTPKKSRGVAKRGAELTDVNVRLIEINPEIGEYRINIQSAKNRKRLEIEFQVTGENGAHENVGIMSFTLGNAALLSDSSLLLKDVQKNQVISGIIKVGFNARVRLGGKTYEIKG
ncbi:hypothetical protein [Loigolactobacillus bifermentans]|uniref:Uncharacterized protein n=1 Tax=Loigolactobacillus bifermentans DSM 20003 TaxID=1423726 RepID=A0A0R1GLL8_9LACO|nr:hypothetical protein [Loigolactobacillus bifermentans]KRK34975.1 hypothetical protein FC07_GL000326 [Loigolactobacillus bifermentans DSM 20003]QGG61328.1 hypothetical protein LB003_13095 [Loigolactobacillus bifermentans]